MTDGSEGATSTSMIESSGGLGGRSGTGLCLFGALKLLSGIEDVMSESKVTVPTSSCPELFKDEILSTCDFDLK